MRAIPHFRSASLLVVLATSFLWLSSCGDDTSATRMDGPGAVVRLFDVATESGAVDRDVMPLKRYQVQKIPMKDCPLVGVASDGSLLTKVKPLGRSTDPKDNLPAFVVRGEGPKSITLPHAFERAALTTVVAMISCYGGGTERARLAVIGTDGSVVERGPWIEYSTRREPRVLRFDLPPPGPDAPEVCDGVALEFEGRGKHAGLIWIELQSCPVGALLPRLGEPATQLVGEHSRTAAGLIEGAAWQASFRTPGQARLHLSIHVPRAVSTPGAQARITVRAKGPGGTQRVRRTIAREAATEWVDLDVDLAVIGAGESTVTLEVTGDGDERTAAVLIGDAVITSPSREAPTVLLITSDTHRADHMGVAFSRPFVNTPALDALARRGLYFEDCQSTTNVTNPSHIAVMTGIHPRDTQIVDNATCLAPDVATLAERFQAAGYRTFAAISTQHLGPEQSGLGQGFDRFETTGTFKRRGADAIQRVAAWLDEAEGEPVFAWIHLFDAHAPYEPPAEVAARYYDGDPKDKARSLDMGGAKIPGWIQREGITDPTYVNALYRGEVDTIDASLASLLDRERVRAGHVAFTADHGESFGTHGIWWDHVGLYPPIVQVPLILAGPGIEPARTSAPVQQFEVGRTLLDLAGIEAAFPGQNLVTRAAEEPVDEPRFAVAAHGLQASVTTRDLFLVMDLRTFTKPAQVDNLVKGRVQVYVRGDGVDSDGAPLEAHMEEARRMRTALIEWLGQAEGNGLGSAVELSAQATVNLDVLGYGGFTERTESTWWSEADVDPEWATRFDE